MVLQKIYVQYRYKGQGYLLPNAKIGVDGESFYEECTSTFDGISTGCDFNLIEGHVYDTAATKDGYYLTEESIRLDFTAPVVLYILLWLFPREPTVVTHDATEVAATSAILNGELTDLDGVNATDVCFLYGKAGESYTVTTEWTYYEPDPFSYEISGLAPDTTYNFKTRANNITEEDTFYVFGDTKQFTTLPAAVYDMYIILPNANGKLFLNNTVIACDDWEKACTSFTFLIKNTGNVAAGAWYTVSVVGGGTLYTGTVPALEPQVGSSYISDTVCALIPGGLPVGTHEIRVEVGPTGMSATDAYTEEIYVIEEPVVEDMQLVLPNPYNLLFVDHTIVACDDPAEACTEFRFQIKNNGTVAMAAWYKVSVVGGGTLYDSTTASIDPEATSVVIDDLICALIPGGLPVGTHTIKVEIGPSGMSATDSHSEDIFVIEEGVEEDMHIVLPNENGKLFLNNTIVACDDPADGCTIFKFLIMNTGNVAASAWYTVTIVGETGPIYTGTVPVLEPQVGSVPINDWVCATHGRLPVGTHEIRVEVGPTGMSATDAYTEEIYVIEEGVVEGMQIILPYPNLLEDDTIIACDDPAKACTYFNFQIKNNYAFNWWPYYEVSIVGGETLYSGTPNKLVAGASTPIIRDTICALPDGLPIGEYTIEVKASPVWGDVTDTHTEVLTVAENIPVVTTEAATSVRATTAYLAGYLVDNLGVETHIGWEYGETTSYGSTLWWGTRSYPGSLSRTLDGLTPNTLYHFRAIATNEYGTGYGVNMTFTTLVEEPPSGVSLSGENYLNVCGAEIANNCISVGIFAERFGSDSECSFYLEYWSEGDTEHNFTTPIVLPYDPMYDEEGVQVQDITVCIPNCEINHYIRGVASNSVGTSYSEITTPITVRLEAPTEVTPTSVTLNAYIVSMGSITNGIANFKYGTPSPNTYCDPPSSVSGSGAISYAITGLTPNTTYQYYLYAQAQYGYPQTKSATVSFTTLPMPGPAVNTGWADTITQTSATLSGLLSDSNDTSTHIGFEYGETEGYGTTIWDSYTSVFTAYETDVSGLSPNTLYHFRAIATNEYGTGYGADMTFTTLEELFDITFIATAPGVSDLHNVDVTDVTDPWNPKYLGET